MLRRAALAIPKLPPSPTAGSRTGARAHHNHVPDQPHAPPPQCLTINCRLLPDIQGGISDASQLRVRGVVHLQEAPLIHEEGALPSPRYSLRENSSDGLTACIDAPGRRRRVRPSDG